MGWPAHSIVEDLEFGLLLLRDGINVMYLPEAKVYAEIVTDGGAARRQRVRWEGGRFQILKQNGRQIFFEALRRRDMALLEAWVDLACPPLGLYAAVLGMAIVVGALLGLVPVVITAAACVILICCHVIFAMWHRRVPSIVWKSLLAVPRFLLGKIPVYLHLLQKGAGTSWVRTLRNGERQPSRYAQFVASGRGRPRWWARCSELRSALWSWRGRFEGLGKRVLDVIGSLVALLLLSPVMLITAILIKLEDGGPVLFRQIRVGLNGRRIEVYKFRSMVINAERVRLGMDGSNHHESGVTFKMRRDPRVTRIGRWIRKFSIDEMPQFINVLRGDMSLVGPRPALPREVACYDAVQLLRLTVKPGISCLWQIHGRADIDFEGQVRLDLEYIHSASIWRDIMILVKTVPAVVLARGAY
jgi:lipopolysaccharide/colanic/teichoic acid biosynthesis glycosyltransferase